MRRTLAPVLSAKGVIVATCSSVVSTADTLASSRTYCNSLHVQPYLRKRAAKHWTHLGRSLPHNYRDIGQGPAWLQKLRLTPWRMR